MRIIMMIKGFFNYDTCVKFFVYVGEMVLLAMIDVAILD